MIPELAVIHAMLCSLLRLGAEPEHKNLLSGCKNHKGPHI